MRFIIDDQENFFKDFDQAYIDPPKKLPFYIRIGAWLSKKIIKKDLMIPKLLAWYPKAAISSGILESLVTHDDGEINKRLLKIIRIQVSVMVACPFCIDMNAFEYDKVGLSLEEINAIKNGDYTYHSFSPKEQVMMEYVCLMSNTPVVIPKEMVDRLNEHFSERGIIIIASTIAQVNYWARLIRSLGIPVAGFGDICTMEKP
ncbi:carboxymuconolactone decarboxylase family protein [Helicobacter sp. MIT 05-5293]|uniref:carboxymuconolactone decarboxylase family protein n=1 Tax=Helicobacter sp. MIT 05-5293 TaxID=1548149 RepID=UPI00051D7E60|nr:carboxymuconolactone decarboxylase family protein [Helicobacter sp. MIT 05-5293]TLD81476.1 carboxymuconolactone decarboxylase family protein [Helicobacter sp. MIT 05-5293]